MVIRRIYYPWWKWECYPAGMYSTTPPAGMSADDCKHAYKDFLADLDLFEYAMTEVTDTWVHSSIHFLTNSSMNRIAWLGQAAMCISTGVSSKFKAGFSLLTSVQQSDANQCAATFLEKWIETNTDKCKKLYQEMENSRLSR